MGYGGSVQAMINSLRNNARMRPNLRTAFNREEIERRKRIARIREWRRLNPSERAETHSELRIQKKYPWKKELVILAVTILLSMAAIWVFLLFVSPELAKAKKEMDIYKKSKVHSELHI
jgi:hypothetical protein